MYKRIMVPLDGSELAECVLPDVEAFIKGFNTDDIFFVRVIKPEKSYRGEYPIDIDILKKREMEATSIAKDYLDKTVDQITHNTTTLHTEVLVGSVTESLVKFTLEKDINLIIIATHGYSGVTRWVRGSVADKVLRSAHVPVLMVRAPGTKGEIETGRQ